MIQFHPNELEYLDGICRYRPRGHATLAEAVELVTRALDYCRERKFDRLLIDATNLEGVPVPSLVDRFLMMEEWAQVATGMVTVVLVISPEYIDPQKFGVKVAAHFGLTVDVYSSEDDALRWLAGGAPPDD
jgi:hypothetical protein